MAKAVQESRSKRQARSVAAGVEAEKQRVKDEVGTKAVARAALRKDNTRDARQKRAAAIKK